MTGFLARRVVSRSAHQRALSRARYTTYQAKARVKRPIEGETP